MGSCLDKVFDNDKPTYMKKTAGVEMNILLTHKIKYVIRITLTSTSADRVMFSDNENHGVPRLKQEAT